MQYTLFSNEDSSNIVVVHDGKMYSATDQHPSWKKIVAGVVAEDDTVTRLFDIQETASDYFERLSDRVTVSNGQVYFDNELVGGELTEQILRFIDEGIEDWKPLVKFYEKIMTNLEPHTREQLYRWLSQQKIAITMDGNFLAYKGVQKVINDDETAKYVSVNSGKAIVDGKVYEGKIPNDVGSIVEMPRADVQHDPSNGCASGLHAGTWRYASDWAQGATLLVEINPRDVVSVPTDCNSAKLRVCRYTVVEVTDQEKSQVVWGQDAYDDYDDDDDEYNWGDNEEDD